MLKVLKLNNKSSLKVLNEFLDKRKVIQKNQTTIVNKIIKNVKINGDKAVLNYEKKFSKLKLKSNRVTFSKKEISNISKKIDIKIKQAIDLAYNRIKKFHSKQKFLSFKFKDKYKNVHFTRMQPDGEEGPSYKDAVHFPNPDDSLTLITDLKSFEGWKEGTLQRYGKVDVELFPEEDTWFDGDWIFSSTNSGYRQ